MAGAAPTPWLRRPPCAVSWRRSDRTSVRRTAFSAKWLRIAENSGAARTTDDSTPVEAALARLRGDADTLPADAARPPAATPSNGGYVAHGSLLDENPAEDRNRDPLQAVPRLPAD